MWCPHVIELFLLLALPPVPSLQVENALQREGQRVPNLTHPAVPLGGEDNAAVLKEVGGGAA